ncbi:MULTISPECIES: pentapeptide repeat-containing protein [unclassified Rhizobium]|uniref:pentapeptide repeat-containing protein n=1 Tax=unclassified Rhizobium TaxID=2613769 RepID=UPI0009E8A7D4|nr:MULTISPECIES: pentapeptide repeat-containing protein [unclassified Rhizobium]
MTNRKASSPAMLQGNAFSRIWTETMACNDFSHADLRGAVFSSSSMFANFVAADLRDADFSNCNLKTCDFSGQIWKMHLFGARLSMRLFSMVPI